MDGGLSGERKWREPEQGRECKLGLACKVRKDSLKYKNKEDKKINLKICIPVLLTSEIHINKIFIFF